MKSACIFALLAALVAGATASGVATAATNKTDFNAKLDLLLAKLEEAKNAPKNLVADIDTAKVELWNKLEWEAQKKVMAFKNATATEAMKVMHATGKAE